MTDSALHVAQTGLEAQQTRISIISNNLANVSTTGYKRSRAVFEDLLYQNITQVGADSTQETTFPSGFQLGTGVRIVATEKIHTQGNIAQTDNSLDIAINGRGYFQILMPNGDINYTRDGGFTLDQNGQIVTSSGYTLDPTVTIPDDAISVTIGSDGIVSILQPGNTGTTQIGAIELADFINPTGLEPIGENLFRESIASGAPITNTPGENGSGILVQGALETSNVNVVEELVNMIETQRAYEMNSKAISTTDEMLQYASNNL